ncbi:50S ribosomal protein L25/general stress protein Ctc [Paenibacillus sp. GCM10023252]|uniref:50S ribosomal protein L25/general stress protein Ctc n=1 Tax=Paenibacillus sp. GCM10023252 TaxID=3252649 RepID=UPI00360ECFB2
MSITMNAEQRTTSTKGELRQLRKQGRVPGVIYGKKLDAPAAITVEEKELQALLRSHPNAVLEINIPSTGKQPVMITDVQRDPMSRQVLHIDLHQINMNEEVKTAVRVEVTGDSAGVREGGVLQINLHEVEVQCLPGSIPESIEVDVTSLNVGDNLLVSDLKAPKGVEIKTDGEQVVVGVLAPQKEITEEEAEDAAVEAVEAESRSEEANRAEMEKA